MTPARARLLQLTTDAGLPNAVQVRTITVDALLPLRHARPEKDLLAQFNHCRLPTLESKCALAQNGFCG